MGPVGCATAAHRTKRPNHDANVVVGTKGGLEAEDGATANVDLWDGLLD